MSEAVIVRRKTIVFLTKISPVYNTHNEVIRNKLEPGKFPQTKTGITRMLSISFQLGAVISWWVLGTYSNIAITYAFISSVSLGLLGELLLFLIFSFGKTVRDPAFWIYGDIAFTFTVSLLTIITSVLSIKLGDNSLKNLDFADNLCEALAITGASLSIISCAGLFLMYRFIEDPGEESGLPRRQAVKDPRKSIFA